MSLPKFSQRYFSIDKGFEGGSVSVFGHYFYNSISKQSMARDLFLALSADNSGIYKTLKLGQFFGESISPMNGRCQVLGYSDLNGTPAKWTVLLAQVRAHQKLKWRMELFLFKDLSFHEHMQMIEQSYCDLSSDLDIRSVFPTATPAFTFDEGEVERTPYADPFSSIGR